MTPQQYSMRRSQERDPLAGRVPYGQEEGQRRSGGGNAHGPLPVPGGFKEIFSNGHPLPIRRSSERTGNST